MNPPPLPQRPNVDFFSQIEPIKEGTFNLKKITFVCWGGGDFPTFWGGNFPYYLCSPLWNLRGNSTLLKFDNALAFTIEMKKRIDFAIELFVFSIMEFEGKFNFIDFDLKYTLQ